LITVFQNRCGGFALSEPAVFFEPIERISFMSTIKEKLSELMKSSMKSGDKETLAFVRNLHAVIRKKEIDDKVDLDDAAVQKIISTSLKQRQDSTPGFDRAVQGRRSRRPSRQRTGRSEVPDVFHAAADG
jgi:hypothetical protein